MRREIDWNVKMDIMTDYVRGFSVEETAQRNGVSVGSVHNVVKAAESGRLPDFASPGEAIEAARDHSIRLRKSGMTLEEEGLALRFLDDMRKEDTSVESLRHLHYSLRAEAHKEEDISQLVEDARELRTIKEEYGMGIEEIMEAGQQSMKQAKHEREQLERMKGEEAGVAKNLVALKEESGLVIQIEGLRTQRDRWLQDEKEARERARKAIEEQEVTEAQLRSYFEFRTAVERIDGHMTQETMAKAVKVSSRGEEYVSRLMKLQDYLDLRGYDSENVLGRLGWLPEMVDQGLDLRSWRQINAAFGEFGIRTMGGIRCLAEAVSRFGGLERAITKKEGELANAEQLLERRLKEIDQSIAEAEARQKAVLQAEQKAVERVNALEQKRQQIEARCEELKREENRERQKYEDRCDKLKRETIQREQEIGARCEDLSRKNQSLSDACAELRAQVTDLTKKKEELNTTLAPMVEMAGKQNDLQTSFLTMKKKYDDELQAMTRDVQSGREMLGLAEQLEAAFRGDLLAGRQWMLHLGNEPLIPRGSNHPWPRPEAAREAIVKKAIEILKDEVISGEQFNQARAAWEVKAERLRTELLQTSQARDEAKAEKQRLEDELAKRDKDVNRLQLDLDATQTRLRWSEDYRGELMSKLRRFEAPARQRRP